MDSAERACLNLSSELPYRFTLCKGGDGGKRIRQTVAQSQSNACRERGLPRSLSWYAVPHTAKQGDKKVDGQRKRKTCDRNGEYGTLRVTTSCYRLRLQGPHRGVALACRVHGCPESNPPIQERYGRKLSANHKFSHIWVRSLSTFFPVTRLKSKLSKVLGTFSGRRSEEHTSELQSPRLSRMPSSA